MESEKKRTVSLYTLLLALTIICGLLTRSDYFKLPVLISTYGGDTLWGLMVFWCFSILLIRQKRWKILTAALIFSFGIEFSQFYHAPWIDYLRGTRIGGLILGFGFKYSELICYSIGIAFGGVIDFVLIKKSDK